MRSMPNDPISTAKLCLQRIGASGSLKGWSKPSLARLKTPNSARDQNQCETDDPGPCRKRLANSHHTKMRSKRNEKQDQRNNPYNHRGSLTGVLHFCVFVLFVESGSTVKQSLRFRSNQDAGLVAAGSRCFPHEPVTEQRRTA